MEQKSLISAIESILFVSGKPLKTKNISDFLNINENDVSAALVVLKQHRAESGIVLLESNGTYQLASNSANSNLVKNFLNLELKERLTEATIEVLGIIAYRQPISKIEIEAIRGVNSQYSLRTLLMRGLIEKIQNPKDQRSVFYQTTTEFLQHLGLTSVAELPEFNNLVKQIKLPEQETKSAESHQIEIPENYDQKNN